MMTLVAGWFVQTTAPQDYRQGDYIALAAILAAGVFVRFWGLGNVGLHGDEETMAMPAMSILENGQPYLPSGMYYSRALLNIYLMSASAWLFGESEWAFRLPSAIAGALAPLAAFFMGRRFLAPQFNLAFVATIALLPALIVISQTARMYVFLVTCLIWFGACLFRWERNQRATSLLLALLAWGLALHFHTLAVFAAPLFLFPGLSRQSWSQLIQGAIALGAGLVAFSAYSDWIASKYPQLPAQAAPIEEETTRTAFELVLSGYGLLVLGSFVAVAAVAALLFFKMGSFSWQRAVPAALLALGLACIAALQYHLGGLLMLAGIVFWVRMALPAKWLLAPVILAAAMAAGHLSYLNTTGLYEGRQLIGALVGMPSVWPILRFLTFSPVAGLLYGIVLLFALARFANGRRLPMHMLFFAMAVWATLLVLGYFRWDIPPRYAVGQVGYFLLAALAGLAFLARELKWVSDDRRPSPAMTAMLAVVAVAVVNPVALARTLNPDYGPFPDHKGAAEYISSLDLGPEAVLIAEDVLQQTYYLERVDYWLRESDNANAYSVMRDGRLVDIYTATPTLGTGAELEQVLDENSGNPVYVIGTGENFEGGVQIFRGRGIAEVLESERMEVVYEGRDGKTKVWRLAGAD